MPSLSSDIIVEILKRVDGTTLAATPCSSSALKFIAFQEWLWENLSTSLWPSTQKEEVRLLISSLGGFRKFYGDCFPLLNVCSKHPSIDFKQDSSENFSVADYNGEEVDDDAGPVSPSDLVSIVDILYNNKSIYSKVVSADGMSHFHRRSCSIFQMSPFRIDLLCNADGNIPSIFINDIEKGKFVDRRKIFLLLNRMRLRRLILINTRTKRAVNLSSSRPLQARSTYWGRENGFTVRFGSILPTDRNALRCDLIACNIMVRCRDVRRASESMNLQIIDIRLELEDEVGNQMNVRESVHAIERAMKWEGSGKE